MLILLDVRGVMRTLADLAPSHAYAIVLLMATATMMPVIVAFAGIEKLRPENRIVSELLENLSPSNVGVAVANTPSMMRAN
ncbi:MAG: hypothetical protein JNK25_12060 [Phycisphaerae bacterium]|nr:hypothetical protein [Phycisphaerae bacterium]